MQKGNSLVTAIKHLQPAFLLFVRLAQAWSFINSQMKAMVNLSILRIATMMLMIWHGRSIQLVRTHMVNFALTYCRDSGLLVGQGSVQS